MYVCMYKYGVDMYLLCMIKVRARWCTCSLWRMYKLLLSVSPSSSSFLLTYIQVFSSWNELARPVMGTIFLVLRIWINLIAQNVAF